MNSCAPAEWVLTWQTKLHEWELDQPCGEPVLAAAILDRLLHHSVTASIRGDSYRLRHRKKAGLKNVPPAGEVNNRA